MRFSSWYLDTFPLQIWWELVIVCSSRAMSLTSSNRLCKQTFPLSQFRRWYLERAISSSLAYIAMGDQRKLQICLFEGSYQLMNKHCLLISRHQHLHWWARWKDHQIMPTGLILRKLRLWVSPHHTTICTPTLSGRVFLELLCLGKQP